MEPHLEKVHINGYSFWYDVNFTIDYKYLRTYNNDILKFENYEIKNRNDSWENNQCQQNIMLYCKECQNSVFTNELLFLHQFKTPDHFIHCTWSKVTIENVSFFKNSLIANCPVKDCKADQKPQRILKIIDKNQKFH